MNISGQCHCGSIAYEAELDREKVGICHCTDCQALSGSAFRTIAVVDAASFKITKGEPKKYVKVSASGNRRIQAFCQDCGSALYAAAFEDKPAKYNLRAGTINQRHELPPRFEYWLQSALPWLPENPGTKKFSQSPN